MLEAIAKSLSERIKGSMVIDCFSNSVDDLCLQFENYSLRCIFYEGTVYFHFDGSGPGRNRLFKPQFTEIRELKVQDVVVHPFERSFHIAFENDFKLVFKCHGRKSNIILFEKDDNIDIFKKHLEKDSDMTMQDIFREVKPVFNPDYFKDKSTFISQYSYLPEEFYELLAPEFSAEKFDALITQYRHIRGISFNDDFEISPLSGEDTILGDISRFSSSWLKFIVFKNNRDGLIRKYENLVREKQNFISGNKKALEDILARRSDEELGNIILSNLHLIKPGDKLVTLNDVYNDRPIELKLDENLNAVENAEKYFKKEKNKPIMIRLLEQKISKAERDLETNAQKLEELDQATQFRSIKHLVSEEQKKAEETDLPYRKFSFEGYDILVGKHAESNEKILNYYSDKDDVWLHAKDVGGSHVLVKVKRGQKLPDKVLEKAASLAAYYSKNRNQDLVTVTHTLRKYVRKIKGADKGKVTVSNEKTVLVRPGKTIDN